MTRIKDIGDILPEQIDEGQLHQISFNSHDALVQESGVDKGYMVELLHGHKSVICPEFAEPLSKVQAHEVFPGKKIEERRSAHGVSFGRLVGYKPTKGRQGHVLSVAMKPFGSAEKAVHELQGYQVLQELEVETYNPVGVFPSKKLENYIVLTEKRNDLMSLDRDSWVHGRQVQNEADVEIAERNTKTVIEIAELLAWLHINGVFHPDGQVKNFAVTDYGKVGVIDPENLVARPLLHFDTATRQAEDFEKLIKSLVRDNKDEPVEEDQGDKIFGVGMLAGMANDQIKKCVDELVVNPYKDALEKYVYERDGNLEQAVMLSTAIDSFAERQPDWTANGNGKH